MKSQGRVSPEAMPCSVARSGLIRGGASNPGVLLVLLPAVALAFSPFFPFSLLSLGSGAQWMATTMAAGRRDER